MRNQVLHGYLIHHRKYRERSHIVHLFTQEYGRIDGVLRQNPPPQYQPIVLQATGKSELKNFSKLEIIQNPIFFFGDAFFAGFYLNELLMRLCAVEVEMPRTFLQYAKTLEQLQHLDQSEHPTVFLKQVLRQFEHHLLEELGYGIDFSHDAEQNLIEPTRFYSFQLGEGFIPQAQDDVLHFSGRVLLGMANYEKGRDFSSEQLQLLSKLYRNMLSFLLGDRLLKSRQLWVQHYRT